jgi:hypothetical protein
MKGKIFVGAVAVLLAAAAWAGDDVWKSKPYDQWDAKEIAAIMKDSPWARPNVQAVGNWSAEDSSTGPINVSQDKTDMNHQNTGRPDATLGDSSAKGAPPMFTVYWWSSRTLREADQRSLVLKGTATAAAADTAVKQVPSSFQVLVIGRDMKAFTNRGENAIRDSASLKLHKSKTKLTPTKVMFQKDKNGNVVDVIFEFDKKTASNEAAIPADEKEVEFDLQLGDAWVRTSFNPKQMVDSQGLDL